MKSKSRKLGPRLTVSLTGKDYATLNTLAEKERVSASWLVRRAIEQFLREHRPESNLSIAMRPARAALPATHNAQRR